MLSREIILKSNFKAQLNDTMNNNNVWKSTSLSLGKLWEVSWQSVTHLFLQCLCYGWGRCSIFLVLTRSGKPTKSAEMQSRNGARNNLW